MAVKEKTDVNFNLALLAVVAALAVAYLARRNARLRIEEQ